MSQTTRPEIPNSGAHAVANQTKRILLFPAFVLRAGLCWLAFRLLELKDWLAEPMRGGLVDRAFWKRHEGTLVAQGYKRRQAAQLRAQWDAEVERRGLAAQAARAARASPQGSRQDAVNIATGVAGDDVE